MELNKFLTRKASTLMLWIGFLLIILGKYLRYKHPLFNEWTSDIQSGFDDVTTGALFLLYPNPITVMLDFVLTVIAMLGMLLMWSMARRRNLLLKIASLAIGSLLALSALAAFRSALVSLLWLFFPLVIGEILWGFGLVCSLIVAFNSIKYSNGGR
jgi:divalent metal cation (Fe/Co/Zn/Cd) transporter